MLTHSCSLHHSIYLYLFLYLFFVPLSISPLCPSVFIILFSVSLPHTVRFHRHPLTSSHPQTATKAEAYGTTISTLHHQRRACAPTRNYSTELEKNRCQFGLDLIQVRGLPTSRLCYSVWFLNQLCTGSDRGGKKPRGGDWKGMVRYLQLEVSSSLLLDLFCLVAL